MPLGHAVLRTDRDKLRKLRQWRYEGSDCVQSVLTPEEWQAVSSAHDEHENASQDDARSSDVPGHYVDPTSNLHWPGEMWVRSFSSAREPQAAHA